MWGWGIPSVHKRAATPIPAQTTQGTKVEEPQGEHGVEVRVRECMRHVNVSKVSHMRHETHWCRTIPGKAMTKEVRNHRDDHAEERSSSTETGKIFFLPNCADGPFTTLLTTTGTEDILPMLGLPTDSST